MYYWANSACFPPEDAPRQFCIIIERRESRDEEGAITKVDIMEFARGFVKGHKRADSLGMSLSSSLTFNFDGFTSIACRSCIPMPQLNPDGSVSSCDMAFYENAPAELQCFIYGKWDETSNSIIYDEKKINYLKGRTLENLTMCSNCQLSEHCAGGCAGRVAMETGSPYNTIAEYCDAIRYIASYVPTGREKLLYTHP